METIELSIPGMKSNHCMMVVSNTLKNVKGVQLKKVSQGQAEIELSGATKENVILAIEKAGYAVVR